MKGAAGRFCEDWRIGSKFFEIEGCAIRRARVYYLLASGHGSVGRAQPCQGWGRGFEPRCPLHRMQTPPATGAFLFWFDLHGSIRLYRAEMHKPEVKNEICTNESLTHLYDILVTWENDVRMSISALMSAHNVSYLPVGVYKLDRIGEGCTFLNMFAYLICTYRDVLSDAVGGPAMWSYAGRPSSDTRALKVFKKSSCQEREA